MWSIENIGTFYRVFIIALFRIISVAMILVGLLIALCIIADNIFHLGWGYPWWSLFFCIVYVGLSGMIYRAIPNFAAYVARQVGSHASTRTNNHKDDR
jgi:hypothetical protein